MFFFFFFFFFFFLIQSETSSQSTWTTRGRSSPRDSFSRREEFFYAEYAKRNSEKAECSRSYLPFGAGVEWRLSFLPTLGLPPACLSLPPPRDHREPTTHSSRIYAITTPCSTPCGRCSSSTRWPLLFFFLNSDTFSRPRRARRDCC